MLTSKYIMAASTVKHSHCQLYWQESNQYPFIQPKKTALPMPVITSFEIQSRDADCRHKLFKILGAKVRGLCTNWSLPRQQIWTLWDDCLASFINRARDSFGRTQNSPLTITCLICFSLCHLQWKQMTWAAWDTGVSNSELVFLREEIWQIFRCWIWLKC